MSERLGSDIYPVGSGREKSILAVNFTPFLPSHRGIPEPSETATTATSHSCVARVGSQLAEAALEALGLSPVPPSPNHTGPFPRCSHLHYLSKRSPGPGTVQGAPEERLPPPGHGGAKLKRNPTIFQEHRR
ncbi:unnamed protein product [Arctogadus glacialis]